MKKITILFILIFPFLFSCSSNSKYSDVKAYIASISKIQHEYIKRLENSKNDVELADAMRKYIDTLLPKIKIGQNLKKKYPELIGLIKKGKTPSQLKEAFDSLNFKADKATSVLKKYLSSKKVLKEVKRMGKLRDLELFFNH